MRVAVIGSGKIIEGIEKYIPEGTTMIITALTYGAGKLAEKWADENAIPKLVVKPDYARYGESAPLSANRLITEISDILVAVWDGKAADIKYAIEYARELGKKVWIYKASELKQR